MGTVTVRPNSTPYSEMAYGAITSSGPNSPGTLADDSSVGTVAWTNPGNAASSNNSYATQSLNNQTGHYLKVTNFGFSIPSDATVTGIRAEVEAKSSYTHSFIEGVKLVKSGTIGGDDRWGDNAGALPTSDTYLYYGGSSALWGQSWAPADINASDFGVAVSGFDGGFFGGGTISIDHIRITVYYLDPTGYDEDGVTSDDEDVTLVMGDSGERLWLGFPDPSLPSGSVLKQYSLLARWRISSAAAQVEGLLSVGSAPTGGSPPPSNTTIAAATINVNWSYHFTSNVCSDYGSDTPYARFSVIGGGPIYITESYLDALYVDQPEVAIAAPSGTITESEPSVTWSDTLDSDGGLQTYYQVKIYDATTFGDFSGVDPDTDDPYLGSGIVLSSSETWTLSDPLFEDDYRVYVRIAQTVNGDYHWSEWDYSDFDTDLVNPADPDVLAVSDDSSGSIALTLDEGAGGDTGTDEFQVQVQRGGDWEELRGSPLPYMGSPLDITDYEASNGVERDYRVRSKSTDQNTVSAWITASATWESANAWLKHPSDPSLNVEVRIKSYPSRRKKHRRSIFQALGSSTAISLSDSSREAAEGTLVLIVEERSDLDAIDNLLDTGLPVLIQCIADADEPDRWVSFESHDRDRAVDKSFAHLRYETLPWTEVAPPHD